MDAPTLTSLPSIAAAAFAVTLGTVIVPGPTTVAASRFGMAAGARFAASFLATVVALDTVIFALLVVGAEPMLRRVGEIGWLAPGGGGVLVVFGAVIALAAHRSDADGAAAPGGGLTRIEHPVLAGVVVPAASPGFWIWWLTVGATFIHLAGQWGRAGVALVFASYLAAVVLWYGALVVAVARGRELLKPRTVRVVQIGLGFGMIVYGGVILVHLLR